MDITILDGYTSNPGDLSWDFLNKYGTVTAYDRTAREDLFERIATTEIAISNKVIWDKEAFDAAPNLKMIELLSTGFNVVNLEEANARGIVVSNVPAYSTPDVAQLAFALILELTHHVGLHAQSVRKGEWVESADFMYTLTPLIELSGKTLGIIGMGSIGQAVAKIAQAFDMNIVFYNRSAKPHVETETCKQVNLDEVLAQSDFLTLHCPASAETENLINENTLARMKDGAFLINTARGNLLDEAAVANALESGKLAGFGADVVRVEPMAADNPLRTAPNSIITPHVAWAAQDARKRMFNIIDDNIAGFAAGNPCNVVNNPA